MIILTDKQVHVCMLLLQWNYCLDTHKDQFFHSVVQFLSRPTPHASNSLAACSEDMLLPICQSLAEFRHKTSFCKENYEEHNLLNHRLKVPLEMFPPAPILQRKEISTNKFSWATKLCIVVIKIWTNGFGNQRRLNI